jgi:pimeloyl-ACP methyl ester carboxylesterase
MKPYSDEYFTNSDGLRQHYRDYHRAGPTAPVVLCMPGLTRNARDFEEVAEHLADRCRVICVEQRGRGLSDRDPDPSRYQPITYVGDMMALLEHLGVRQVVALGTSLGGLMTILMQAMHPGVFSAAIINDIGPEVDPVGLKRIQGYVGKTSAPKSWDEAITQVQTANTGIFPHFTAADWDQFARKLYIEVDGVIRADYDPLISQNLNQNEETAAPDLWTVFRAMTAIPLLVIRGELSDILSEITLGVMAQVHPEMVSVTVPGVGHAPLLREPECLAAIDALIGRLIKSNTTVVRIR